MKQGGQKPKGNSFETRVAEELSLWITLNESKDVFIRSPSSGARATVLAKLGRMISSQAGDVISLSNIGLEFTNKFLIECKHYQDLYLDGLLFNSKTGINFFWAKLLDQCETHKKLPFLISKQNYKETLLGLNSEGVSLLKVRNLIISKYPKLDLNLLFYTDFLKSVHPDVLQPTTVTRLKF